MAPKILVEGRPGSGKTTVCRRVVRELQDRGIEVRGFTTEEVRVRGRRIGFDIETVAGTRAALARVGLSSEVRVGRYGVDVDAFERVALPTLLEVPADGVVVIDEIGKMELASEAFRQATSTLFAGDIRIVAAVHVFSDPLTDALKRRDDTAVIRITVANRNDLPRVVVRALGLDRP